MIDLLLSTVLWIAVTVVAVVMFSLGAALGRRGAWERGYEAGRAVRPANLHRHVPHGVPRRPLA